MTEEQRSFLMYGNWQPLFSCLSDEDAGKLIKALFDFAVNGSEAGCLPPNVEGLYIFMSETIKQNMSKWEESKKKRIEAGRLGGLAKSSNAKQSQAKPSNAKHNVNVNVNDNVSTNVDTKEILSKESTKKSTNFSLSRFDDELLLFPEFPDDPEVKQMFKEFIEMRNAKGKANAVNTMATFKGLVKALLTKSEGDIETMKAMIEYSTVRGYQTFYDPKENKTITQQKTKAQVNDLDAAFERVFGKGAK